MTPLRQVEAMGVELSITPAGKLAYEMPPELAADVREQVLEYAKEHKPRILAELLGDKLCGSDLPGMTDDRLGRRCHYNCEHREALPDMCWWVWRCGKTGQRTHSTAMCGAFRECGQVGKSGGR